MLNPARARPPKKVNPPVEKIIPSGSFMNLSKFSRMWNNFAPEIPATTAMMTNVPMSTEGLTSTVPLRFLPFFLFEPFFSGAGTRTPLSRPAL